MYNNFSNIQFLVKINFMVEVGASLQYRQLSLSYYFLLHDELCNTSYNNSLDTFIFVSIVLTYDKVLFIFR